ncbi:MAG: ABC transporter ATP-binding protein [Betaproteobacteria bacterium]|nr:ABC transporter ATP-binding protein [Betaproteobacteria bacterium]
MSRTGIQAGSFLALEGVDFGFDGVHRTVDGVHLALARGEVQGITGRSGCGKSTLLKLAAGLLAPQAGRVTVGRRPPQSAREDIGFMFQQPTLLEWLTALDNVLLPVSLQGRPDETQRARALQLLEQVGLADLAHRRPGQLSGGQQSRVALARALVLQPSLLLLDEPFAALDALTRETLQQDLITLCTQQGRTVLFVTHDIAEAVFLADRVSVMDSGRIVDTITVTLPRPRDPALRGRPEFAAFGARVREALQRNIAEPHRPHRGAAGHTTGVLA